MILNSNVKYLRYQNRMTQADVAEKSGLTIGMISRIENDHTFPNAYTLWKLAYALCCSVDELYNVSNE